MKTSLIVLVVFLAAAAPAYASDNHDDNTLSGDAPFPYVMTPLQNTECALAMAVPESKGIICIKPDGDVEIPPGVTPTQAAREFWNAVATLTGHKPPFPADHEK